MAKSLRYFPNQHEFNGLRENPGVSSITTDDFKNKIIIKNKPPKLTLKYNITEDILNDNPFYFSESKPTQDILSFKINGEEKRKIIKEAESKNINVTAVGFDFERSVPILSEESLIRGNDLMEKSEILLTCNRTPTGLCIISYELDENGFIGDYNVLMDSIESIIEQSYGSIIKISDTQYKFLTGISEEDGNHVIGILFVNPEEIEFEEGSSPEEMTELLINYINNSLKTEITIYNPERVEISDVGDYPAGEYLLEIELCKQQSLCYQSTFFDFFNNNYLEEIRFTGEFIDSFLSKKLVYSSLYGCLNLKKVDLSGLKNFSWGIDWADCDGNESLKEFIFPEIMDNSSLVDEPLFEIPLSFFDNCISLESVKLPKNLEIIGYWAFRDCHNLKEVDLPNSLTTLELYSFSGCGLEKLTLPGKISYFNSDMVNNCTNLKELTILSGENPETDKLEIGNQLDLPSLQTISLGKILETDNTIPLFTENNQIKSVNFLPGCLSVSGSWVASMYNLKYLKIPNTVQTFLSGISGLLLDLNSGIEILDIDSELVYFGISGLDELKEIIIGPNVKGLALISEGDLINLKRIVVDENNQTLDSRNDCNAIIETESGKVIFGCAGTKLPENSGISELGVYAFYNVAIPPTSIPEGITKISGNYVFLNCKSTYLELPATLSSTDLFSFKNCTGILSVKCPNLGEVKFYNSNFTKIILKDGVKIIGQQAFESCKKLTTIIIPKTVTSIDSTAFEGCTSLRNIIFEGEGDDSALTISSETFNNCPIESVYINRKGLPNDLFTNNSTIREITFGNNITSIGERQFYGCSNLSEINISQSIETVGKEAFHGTKWYSQRQQEDSLIYLDKILYDYTGEQAWDEVIIKPKTKCIVSGIFQNKSNIFSITIPPSIILLEDEIFLGCTGIKNVIFEDGSKTLELGYNKSAKKGLFNDCPLEYVYLGRNLNFKAGSSYGYSPFNININNIVIGKEVTKIPKYLLYNCNKVISINIPKRIMSIGESSFRYCSGLTSITIPENVTSIEDKAFADCSSLTTIACHAVTPPTIYSSTFYGVSKSIPVYVPENSVNSYKSASYWKEFTNIQLIDG